MERVTLSDHQYIIYEVLVNATRDVGEKEIDRHGCAVKRLDRERLRTILGESKMQTVLDQLSAEEMASATTKRLAGLCNATMPRHRGGNVSTFLSSQPTGGRMR